jgi:hypothetical protein
VPALRERWAHVSLSSWRRWVCWLRWVLDVGRGTTCKSRAGRRPDRPALLTPM